MATLTEPQLRSLLESGPMLDRMENAIDKAPGKTAAMEQAADASITLQRDAANHYTDAPGSAPISMERTEKTMTELYWQYNATRHTGMNPHFARLADNLGLPPAQPQGRYP
ncbi:MAG: hypothetical protein K2Q01_00165 [Rickettsiales bacterium]|nr:hypothetical protein [Rickettsiales bacterium]